MKLTEFEIINRYFKQPFADLTKFINSSQFNSAIDLSIGDDCAIFDCPVGYKIVTSTDQLIESVHFFKGLSADLIAKKALIKALSDLMAMGASPVGFTLALSTPKQSKKWFELFSSGLLEVAKAYQIPLIGGDLAKSPSIHLVIQVIGKVQSAKRMLRSQLQLRDEIYVTQTIGASGYALAQIKKNQKISAALAEKYYQPKIPLQFAVAIRDYANAAIDLSDGLLQDIFHLMDASQKGVSLNLSMIEQFVLDVEAKKMIDHNKTINQKIDLVKKLINQGDDYQLVFSAPKQSTETIKKIARDYSLQITAIGEVIEPIKMVLSYENSNPKSKAVLEEFSLEDFKNNQLKGLKGYQHF